MAIVSENEQAVRPPVDVSTNSNPENESVCKMVDRLLAQSKDATKNFRKDWPRNYQFLFGGRQWPIERPEWRFSEVVNLLWADVMTEVGIQTDARPKVDFIAKEPSDIAFVEILKEINDMNWQKYPWLQRVAESILDTKWVHVAHMLDEWNPELEDGLGDIEKTCMDPYGCYWDNTADDIETCRYFIYAKPVPTEWLKVKYPEKAKEIQSDISVVGGGTGTPWEKTSTDQDSQQFSLSGSRGRRPYPGNDQFGGEAMSLWVRCWMKDDATEELINEKQDNGEIKKEYVLKKKYPKGRFISKVGKTVLEDRENGVVINGQVVPYKHGKFPIIRWVNYSMAREYAGENEITHNMGPQIICNYIWSFTLDTMKQASNPIEVYSAANMDAADQASNQPGEKRVLPDFNGFRREPGLGVPPNLQNLFEEALKIKDKVQGLPDVMRGAVDPGVTSGLLFDGYVEAAQVRPRFKSRNVDQALQRMGQLDEAYMLQFYTAPRTYRITNKEGWPTYVTFSVAEQKDGTTIAQINTQAQNQNGVWTTTPQQMVIKGTPDVQVTSGSSIPFQKSQQYNRDKELFQMQAIDQQALLEGIDYPNKEQVMQRMQQQQQAQMEAQQQAQGGPPAA